MSQMKRNTKATVADREQHSLRSWSRVGSVIVAVSSVLLFRRPWVKNLILLVLAGCLIYPFLLGS